MRRGLIDLSTRTPLSIARLSASAPSSHDLSLAAFTISMAESSFRYTQPLNSFSEFNKAEGGDIWFALDESRPLACFAGIWTNWTSVREVKEGETTNDIFAFLTTEPNAEVGAIHPKAMPVILTTPNATPIHTVDKAQVDLRG